jgi:membrane-bound metal-dependent hydrolase YbcI (DUF457 family)
MLFLGHVGITLGITEIAGNALQKWQCRRRVELPANLDEPYTPISETPARKASVLVCNNLAPEGNLASEGKIDYRLVLLSSLLPDVIDKPLGIYLLPNRMGNGRAFGHSVAFVLALWVLGGWLYLKRGKPWGIYLALGTILHLALDRMWDNPRTLLWPVHGWSFERNHFPSWLTFILNSMFTDPNAYIPEIMGGTILTRITARVIKNRRVLAFIKFGTIK